MKRSCFVRSTWQIALIISHAFSIVHSQNGTVQPDEHLSWKYLEWNYDNQQDEENAIESGAYNRDNAIPGGFAMWRDTIFITVPRLLPGVPATLNYVHNTNFGDKSPKLTPYPSWSYNDLESCDDNLISAFRIEVDQCDRLWVIDAGSFWTDSGLRNQCPPRLIVFDLLTNETLRRYDLPFGFMPKGTLIANIAVDSDSKSCDDTFAYISSVRSNSLMVYDWRKNSSWLFPIEKTFEFRANNDYLDISGMTISHSRNSKEALLLFHPFNGNGEYGVLTSELRHTSNVFYGINKCLMYIQKHQSYSSSSASGKGFTFYSDTRNNAIRVSLFKNNNIVKYIQLALVTRNDDNLIYPIEIKIYGDTLWILSNRMPTFLNPGLNYRSVNFRLSKLNLPSVNIAGIYHFARRERLQHLVLR